MSDISKELTKGLETHHTIEQHGVNSIDTVSLKIPNIVRLSTISKIIRSEKGRVTDTISERDDLEDYLIDTQAKILLFRELLKEKGIKGYEDQQESVNNWDNLFQELITYYYQGDKEEFEEKVLKKIRELEEPNPNKNNLSYKQRFGKLLENPMFKRFLRSALSIENKGLSNITIREFIETANSLNLYKIFNKIGPDLKRNIKGKEFFLEAININEIKKNIQEKLLEAQKIKNSGNLNIEELRKIDQEIKILLAPILRKISLAYRIEPGKTIDNSEGTSLSSVILKNEAACGGAAEIIRLVTEYFGLEGRSVYYPGHVNYELELPSGDILLNDNNGNFGINPETGEATEKVADYYKTLQKISDYSELTDQQKEIVYRRLNSNGEIEYYLPKDGKNYPYLQFGRTSSKRANIPQALVNNMPKIFVGNNPEEGLYFINLTYLENNPFGTELQTSFPINQSENYILPPERKKDLFLRMLEINRNSIFTCQNLAFIEEQISLLPYIERKNLLVEGQNYLLDLLNQDADFFIFLKLHANLYLFQSMLLKEGIGDSKELKNNILQAIEIYKNEIEKYPTTDLEGKALNREYQEKKNKIKNKIEILKYLLDSL
jgi:hypothetical protein